MPDYSVLLSFTFFKHVSNQKISFFSKKIKSSPMAANGTEPKQPSLEKVRGSFVTGFTDAEGSFIVSIYRRPNIKVG
jgi:hypothetical protein